MLAFSIGCSDDKSQKDNQMQRTNDNASLPQDKIEEVIINDSKYPSLEQTAQVQEPQGFAIKLPKTQSLTISELLEKSKKVKSYSVYPASLGKDRGVRYNYLGNRIKVELFYQKLIDGESYIDTVFLDTVNKTAIGFCWNTDKGICKSRRERHTLNYEDYYVETPYDWYAKLDSLEYINSVKFGQRTAAVASTTYNGYSARVWIDDYYGILLKIEMYKNEEQDLLESYTFNNLYANNLKLSDMEYI